MLGFLCWTQWILFRIMTVTGYDLQMSTVFLCQCMCGQDVFFVACCWGIHAAKQQYFALFCGFG